MLDKWAKHSGPCNERMTSRHFPLLPSSDLYFQAKRIQTLSRSIHSCKPWTTFQPKVLEGSWIDMQHKTILEQAFPRALKSQMLPHLKTVWQLNRLFLTMLAQNLRPQRSTVHPPKRSIGWTWQPAGVAGLAERPRAKSPRSHRCMESLRGKKRIEGF